MNKLLFILPVLLWISSLVYGQEGERPEIRPVQFYVGVHPMLTAEPFDEFRQTIDVNMLPLVVEYAINRRWSARLNAIVNLQFRPELPSAVSQVGGSLTVPYHFSKKNDEEGQRGFYAGPNLALTQHKTDGFNSVTLAAEIGYAVLINRHFSITFGVQAGQRIMFLTELGYNRIANHRGAIFSLGYWF